MTLNEMHGENGRVGTDLRKKKPLRREICIM
jgi:hypothetical protein